ncbi:apolipoprotein N-acyltransferase [Herbihabitans rhizosphaerae]|uniref:Apolipoprotein N-acyltransferase n=1 Tax=Herbihabitans rhizosphaerae TaxID=1872711 RepID=A0A4V2EU90_9PSEU|nr:apolipoprotein N-acyltransferase [Herbihabitans rhizosphaerae]RZS43743.1 apolipoprotein N-acyltransferase [Herbihabitans rhizosphaerae]
MVAPTLSPDEPATPETSPPSRARRAAPVLARGALAVGAGVLEYLSFPPRTVWFLAPIGFAILYWLLHGRRGRAGYGYGLLFGLGLMIPLLAWTGVYVGLIASVPLALAMSLLLALPCAAISVLSTVLPAAPVWAAMLWVAGEGFRSIFPFDGIPWGKTAFGQPDGPYVALAAVGGTPLVAFAVALTGFGLAAFVRVIVERRVAVRVIVAPALAFVLPIVAAVSALPMVGTDAQAGTITVAAVQGNVPRLGLDFNAQRRAVLDNHVKRTEQLAADVNAGRVKRPDVVIWPENSSDIDPYRNGDAREAINRAARAIGVPIAVGAVLVGDDGNPRNTVVLWTPDAGPTDTYTKRQLQPFGETMPMRSFFRLFSSTVDKAGNFQPGSEPTVFAVGAARIGLATCWEVAFDDRVRDSTLNGANLLAVPTNNATFGLTEMTYQQLAMDRVRAVEHGRAVIVAATSGTSAIVRPDGSVVANTDLFVPAALVEEVPLRTATTLSDRLGALPEWLMVAAGLAALGVAIVMRRRRRDPGREEENNGGPATEQR